MSPLRSGSGMGSEARGHAALQPDTAIETTRPVAADGPVRLVPKPDRRQHRVVTPECPRCQWRDDVTVSERSRVALQWSCSRCEWVWWQRLSRTEQALPMAAQRDERPEISHWTCPDCARYTVRFATATGCVTYYGCGAVSQRSGRRFGHSRGCWEPDGPLPPGCDAVPADESSQR